MSAEFMREYDEDTIVAAVGNMERNIHNSSYVSEYVQEIQNTYEEYPGGHAEMLQMIRAAQFVTNRPSDDHGEDVQAFYFGELLGHELINKIRPGDDEHFKTGFAHSYVDFKMRQDRPIKSEFAETNLGHEARMAHLAKSIRDELSYPLDGHGLHSMYEEFGLKITSKLSDDPVQQDLTLKGFRMIVLEALKPASATITQQLLDQYPVPLPTTINEEQTSGPSIAELEAQYANSIERTEEIIGPQKPFDFVEWDDVTYIKKTLYRKYLQLEVQAAPLASETPGGSDRAIEEIVDMFNDHRKLINKDDLLSIRGELFASISDEKVPNVFNANTEIRGIFESLRVTEAPINTRLPEALNDPFSQETHENHLEPTLAIRLSKVALTHYIGDEPTVVLALDQTIDIPLSYKNVTVKRIKALKLEADT